MGISEHGYWWRCSVGSYDLLIAREREEGFSRDEAEKLVNQVLEESKDCRVRGKYKHSLVTLEGEEFYVILDGSRGVRLPKLVDGSCGRTKDKSMIPGFRDSVGLELSDIN